MPARISSLVALFNEWLGAVSHWLIDRIVSLLAVCLLPVDTLPNTYLSCGPGHDAIQEGPTPTSGVAPGTTSSKKA